MRHHIRVETTPGYAAEMLENREAGHRMALALWPRQSNLTPRSELDLLWAVTSIDPLMGTASVLVQANRKPERQPAWALTIQSAPVAPVALGEHVVGDLTLVAMYTPSTPLDAETRRTLDAVKAIHGNGMNRNPGEGLSWRAKMIPVPEDLLEAWVVRRLGRYGLDGGVEVVRTFDVRLPGKRGGYRCATVSLDAHVTDATKAEQFLAGVGKGKSYGFGLVVPH